MFVFIFWHSLWFSSLPKVQAVVDASKTDVTLLFSANSIMACMHASINGFPSKNLASQHAFSRYLGSLGGEGSVLHTIERTQNLL